MNNHRKTPHRIAILTCMLTLCLGPVGLGTASAQTATIVPPQDAPKSAQATLAPVTQAPPAEQVPKAKGFDITQYASLLFTYWEQEAIEDARRSRGLVRAPSEFELMRDLKKTDRDQKEKPPPEERDIALGGIVYHAAKDWTIWLNNKRVTPKALPEEIIDLRVFRNYIEMKWFDEYTNQIFPIRLRPHQRFNIDVRMFLPGEGLSNTKPAQ